MPGLPKQNISINFMKGLDTKSDPFQVQAGKFLTLTNMVFNNASGLQKRNGIGSIASTDSSALYLTTFNSNPTTIGATVSAYAQDSNQWVSKGTIKSVSLNTLPLIRSNLNQSQVDCAKATNGYVCTVYTDVGAATTYKYAVADSITGQNITAPIAIPVASGTVTGSPRVFALGNYFIVVFTNVITAVSHLQYIAISINNPSLVTANTDLASAYISATTLSWDGLVVGNKLYVAYNTTTGGQSIKITYINSSLSAPATPVTYASEICTIMSMSADMTNSGNPIIYLAYYDLPSTTGKVAAIDQNLNKIISSPATWIAAGTINNVTCQASSGAVRIYYETANNYGGAIGSVATNFVSTKSCTQAGSVSSATVVLRDIGLASKAFLYSNSDYFLAIQSSAYQPTYFLVHVTSLVGQVVSKWAYQNGGPYYILGLPNAQLIDNNVTIPYLFKDLIQSVNKGTAIPAGTQVAQIYSQTGLNLATLNLAPTSLTSAEIGSDLHISGGFLTMYDGYLPVEHGFFLYPENLAATWSATGGSIVAKPDGATNTNAYYYQATYEWSDNQGNIFRSAPSIPIAVTTSGTGVIGSITVLVPTLRLTYKLANPVKIVLYRWSVAQQSYYQVTSIVSPVINDVTVDYITIVDTLADSSILGNNLLYTTGGVIENIAAPATDILNLFNNRLFLVDSEDRNLLWYSKQVIEAVPVDMSDLLTYYVAPTVGSQGSTGPTTSLFSMDDKQILFKANAIYYMNGTGPDSTGANSNYSDPIFITASVGCANPNSLVMTPNGIMFQSDKGIWLLDRSLGTSYIGADVEGYNANRVTSAVTVPSTNQVRFTLDNGISLMYDYYVGQWGDFSVSGISSVIANNAHFILKANGVVGMEIANQYLDFGSPVLTSFTTSWLSLAGLQGFERFYMCYLLGQYFTPFKLNIQMAFDFEDSPSFATTVLPDNFSPAYGTSTPYGGQSPYGGPGKAFKARIFPNRQKCESFQVLMNELYDPSKGISAGQGLSLSAMNIVYGAKKGFRTQSAGKSFG